MSIFENLFSMLMVLACFAIGVGIIYIMVYNCMIVPMIPKSQRWAKTKGKVVGKNDYTTKTRRSEYDFRSGFNYQRKREKLIEYTVDGKVYRKSVPDIKGAAHIYYKKSNPHYFKTVWEIKQSKREKGRAVMSVICFIMGAGFVAAGIFCLLELIEKIFG